MMEQFHYNHSLRNIPTASAQQYKSAIIPKVSSFLNRLRWYIIFATSKILSTNPEKKTYGFPSPNTAPTVPELVDFQNDLYKMVREIEFRETNNNFQANLKKTVKDIKKNPKVIIAADKTRNLYTMSTNDYRTTLSNNITSEYKKAKNSEINKTNRNAALIAKELGIADRVDEFTKPPPFITVKDHKPDFPDNKSYRLLNPAKSNLGKVSKQILQKAVKKIRKVTEANLWTNTADVQNWFNKTQNKDQLSFIKFDIEKFYPSITQNLFSKAITWAKEHYNFTDIELRTIHHTKEAYLFMDNKPWRKKTAVNFDVTMGSYDGAECCELVGLFLLNNIKQIIPNKQVGLYRDDGLAVVQGNNSQLKRMEKKLHQLFKSFNLKIEVTFGMKSTDFLDIILDLSTDSYRPHMKDNNKPVYIHSKSNHPPNIKRQLPVNIAKRISDLSSNELILHREKLPYQQALHEAGYNVNLDYTPPPPPPPTTTQRRRTRSRKTIYFNPPYCQNVKTNVGKKFLSLIDKHFANTPLEKYINRSTIKISYSTMPNIASIISSHNKKILNTELNLEEGAENRTCNCRYKNTCPQAENCLQESVIYKAEVTHIQGRAAYIGLTGGQFKTRYNLHTRSFRNRDHKNDTTLSQYIWKQTDKGIKFKWHPDPKTNVAEIKWSYLATAPTYSTTTNTCILCNREKAEILYSDDPDLLNKRDEITSKCRHRKKFLLSSHLPEG